ncbi:SulP family inorganic anion transporter [Gordonia defluvii]|jgi:high affinity sulfate transporter 1|uniref:SulP family inorganic anion transporter n=1 Tax=Gordonia defluvii TaxID=283718 RepID=A0ABP6L173_9ACTN|nr:SulP family inorganic anion transporter [Gordonia sp. UBA5067]
MITPPGGYRLSWLRTDIMAGVSLAAVAIPEAMGYSTIAGVPISAGIYTLIVPPVLFAVLGASRLMVVGADSATAALLASGITGLGVAGLVAGTEQWLALTAIVALLAGVLLTLAWVLRLGFLGDFLSTAALTGFLAGVGVSVLIGQLPYLLGVRETAGRPWHRVAGVVGEIGHANPLAVAFAAVSLVALVAGRRFAPKLPLAVGVVIGSILVVWSAGLGHRLPVVGDLPTGLPRVRWPAGLDAATVAQLLPLAAGCALVILAQSAATARSFAQRFGENADVNRDLLGLAAANAGAGLTGTFVVNGSPTKTEFLADQHGRSQVANLVLAATSLAAVVFAGPALGMLPHAVLGAIVTVIATRLIDVGELRAIWRVRRPEFVIAVLTALAVIVFGVRDGIILAVVTSLVEIIRRQYRPEKFVVGVRRDGGREFVSAQPGVQSLPGLIVFRYDADLFYANASRFTGDVIALIRAAPDPVQWLVLDCSSITDVDYSAARDLNDLIDFVHARGAHFVLAGADAELQQTLENEGILALLNADHLFHGIGSAVRAFRAEHPGSV